MKGPVLALSAAIAFCVLPASAAPDQWPPIRPGYWQVTTVFFADIQHPVVTHYCIDKDTTRILELVIEGELNAPCTHSKETFAGHRVVIDAVCKMGKTEGTLHTVADFPTDTAFHSKSTAHYARLKTPDFKLPETGKWVGACPKDFEPGDVLTNDGALVHIGPDGKVGPINPG